MQYNVVFQKISEFETHVTCNESILVYPHFQRTTRASLLTFYKTGVAYLVDIRQSGTETYSLVFPEMFGETDIIAQLQPDGITEIRPTKALEDSAIEEYIRCAPWDSSETPWEPSDFDNIRTKSLEEHIALEDALCEDEYVQAYDEAMQCMQDMQDMQDMQNMHYIPFDICKYIVNTSVDLLRRDKLEIISKIIKEARA